MPATPKGLTEEAATFITRLCQDDELRGRFLRGRQETMTAVGLGHEAIGALNKMSAGDLQALVTACREGERRPELTAIPKRQSHGISQNKK